MGRIFIPGSDRWKRNTPRKPLKCSGVEFSEGSQSWGGSSLGAGIEIYLQHPHRRISNEDIFFRAMKVLEDHLDELVEIDEGMAEDTDSRFPRKTSYNYDPKDKDGYRFTSRRRTSSRRGRRARRKNRQKEAERAPDIY